jgi:predicted glycoside hydrolase/deacetylase ChbG (UPF0249 family)
VVAHRDGTLTATTLMGNGAALRAARTRLKKSREHELAALVAPEVRQAVEQNGIDLVDYRSL